MLMCMWVSVPGIDAMRRATYIQARVRAQRERVRARTRVRHWQPAASHVALREHAHCVCFCADVLICMHIKVAMYAIDAMRQLAFKFLEKDELTSFHF